MQSKSIKTEVIKPVQNTPSMLEVSPGSFLVSLINSVNLNIYTVTLLNGISLVQA